MDECKPLAEGLERDSVSVNTAMSAAEMGGQVERLEAGPVR